MKGFLALLMETLNAAHKFEVDDIVLDSIAKTMEKNDFLQTAYLQLSKGVISAERMAHEMEEVARTLSEADLPSVMASATKNKLEWCSRMELAEYFNHEMPDTLKEILDAIDLKSA